MRGLFLTIIGLAGVKPGKLDGVKFSVFVKQRGVSNLGHYIVQGLMNMGAYAKVVDEPEPRGYIITITLESERVGVYDVLYQAFWYLSDQNKTLVTRGVIEVERHQAANGAAIRRIAEILVNENLAGMKFDRTLILADSAA